MCGIAGYWDRDGVIANPQVKLRAAVRALARRGPDASGIWTNANQTVGLIHRRLAIIDLNERSVQPMISRSQKSVITFNGEIYNFKDLRNQITGVEWRTTSDTEVLLEGLEKNGDKIIPKLDGMFAFAQFDQQENELTLAVDPFGKKPLYTYWDGKVFAFSSEIKGLSALGVFLEISQDHFSEYLLFGSPFGEATVFKNVRRLLGGYSQKVVNGIPQKPECYWDLPIGKIQQKISYGDAMEETKNLIRSAVQKRLVADVPLGCFLSGGLDSSVIALEAQSFLPGRDLRTYSVGFPDQADFDETHFARTVAQRIGSRHMSLDGKPPQSDQIESILAHFDEPCPDSSLLPTFALCREVSQQVKVALSGDGGDEIFGGYRRMQASLFTERWGGLLALLLKPLEFTGLQATSPQSKMGYLMRLQKALKFPVTERLLHWNSYFTEESLRSHMSVRWEKIEAKLTRWEEALQGHDLGQKILYFNIKTYLFSDLLPKVDRMSMYHGLEVRSPLLDKKLAEFAFSLPTKFKFNYFQTKKILKDSYRDQLGSDIVDRAKHGFATPIDKLVLDWQKTSAQQLQHMNRVGLGDVKSLLESQGSTLRHDSCAFALWSASANLAELNQERMPDHDSPVL